MRLMPRLFHQCRMTNLAFAKPISGHTRKKERNGCEGIFLKNEMWFWCPGDSRSRHTWTGRIKRGLGAQTGTRNKWEDQGQVFIVVFGGWGGKFTRDPEGKIQGRTTGNVNVEAVWQSRAFF